MNQNNTKLDLVNPLNPNQIVKSEILTNNSQNIVQDNQQNINDSNQNNIENKIPIPLEVKNEKVNNKTPKKKNNLLLIIIILLVVIALVVGVLFFLQKNKNKPNNNSEVNETKKEVITYEYNINDIKESTIQINDKYNLRITIVSEDLAYLYINDMFISDHMSHYPIQFYMVDDNLIYISGGTDVRSEAVHVIDTNLNVKVIYELDSIKGMVPSAINVKNDGIVIEGTRLFHGPSVIYGDSGMTTLLYDSTTWAQYGITEDTIIKATYTYKFENGNLNMQPTISNQVTIKEYLQNNAQ